MGSFNDYIYAHENNRHFKLSFSITPDRTMGWRVSRGSTDFSRFKRFEKPNINVFCSFRRGTQDQTISEGIVYTYFSAFGEIQVAKFRKTKGAYSGLVSRKEDEGFVKFSPKRKSKFYDVTQSPRITTYTSYTRSEISMNMRTILDYLTRQFEIMASNIYYIGPIREEPSILYSGAIERPQDVGISGEDAASVLWVERSVSKKATISRKVEYWLNEFQISKDITFKKLGPFFQLLLTDWHMGIKANLTEVGFGASQLLPVIVEGYYSPENSLIIAEQPEIHLHPKAQTLLADLFIDVANQNKKMLIETHSEHLLTRIQRRIAENVINNNDVALYYCEPTTEGTRIINININEFGQLGEGLPVGFFEDGFTESKEHLHAMMKKKGK